MNRKGNLVAVFEPISLQRQDEYLERLSLSSISASDYSFVNLWGWAKEYGLSWSWSNDLIWIRQSWPEHVFWAPVGLWQGIEWEEALAGLGEPEAVFSRVPHDLMEIWKNRFAERVEIQEARDQWDYVYSVDDLVSLRGNRYHKKKNLLNQFMKKYSYEYLDMSMDLTGKILAMQQRWCEWRDCESSELLAAENRAVERLLGSWNGLRNVTGGALFVDGREAAFCLAERFSPEMLIIHAEKGFPEYSGVYQAINQMFLSAHREAPLVNREQDLGEEGMRKAKMSYHPVDFIRKYRIRFIR